MGRQGTVLSLIAADGVEQFSQIIKRLDIELQVRFCGVPQTLPGLQTDQ